VRHGGSPKSGVRERGLDVRAAKGKEEVQNREAGEVNWTLEQRKARKKSKTGKPETRIKKNKKVLYKSESLFYNNIQT
jgi:hypothetical protein